MEAFDQREFTVLFAKLLFYQDVQLFNSIKLPSHLLTRGVKKVKITRDITVCSVISNVKQLKQAIKEQFNPIVSK